MNIALLLSGGMGTRLGADVPKQYLRVADQMIITYSLKTLMEHSEIDGIVIVAEEEWRDAILSDLTDILQDTEQKQATICRRDGHGIKMTGEVGFLQNCGYDSEDKERVCPEQGRKGIGKKIAFAVPGDTRQFSILSALHYIRNEWNCETGATNILIHDAARPNLSSGLISKCMEALKEHEGVMPVLPMKDTVYESMDGIEVTDLLDRSRLFAGQAPEGFRFERYYEANRKLLPDRLYQMNGATEPAVLAGMDVVMIPGDENNFKITTKSDLEHFRVQIENYVENMGMLRKCKI